MIYLITYPIEEVINNKKNALVVSILVGLKIAQYAVGVIFAVYLKNYQRIFKL